MQEIPVFDQISKLSALFRKYTGLTPESVSLLPLAGSERKYYRILADKISMLGACNPIIPDHEAFLFISEHFRKSGLPVPEIYFGDPNSPFYLLQDLGDETLFNRIAKIRTNEGFDGMAAGLYEKVLVDLIRFQLEGDENLNYSSLPVPAFNAQSMHWDLNYFKYYFLKPSQIFFDEQVLQQEFNDLAANLAEEKMLGFMYRDFQARNIMLHQNQLYYIDYQGGRKGPLHYDVVSLLFQVKAALPDQLKDQLIDFYIAQLQKHRNFSASDFRLRLNDFLLLRLLQVMGAYGYRGWFEHKPHFLESVTLLHNNINWIFDHKVLENRWPELERILKQILENMENNTLLPKAMLTVNINSFSYKRGIPYDPSGHGGGFVFDCRLLPNPGRLEEFRQLTGLDQEVINFLEGEPQVLEFIQNTCEILQQSVQSYSKAGYEHLQVNFGCTGGRHRSVYCAMQVAELLKKNQHIHVFVKHQELPKIIVNE